MPLKLVFCKLGALQVTFFFRRLQDELTKEVISVYVTKAQSKLCVSQDNLIKTLKCYKFNTVNSMYIIH